MPPFVLTVTDPAVPYLVLESRTQPRKKLAEKQI